MKLTGDLRSSVLVKKNGVGRQLLDDLRFSEKKMNESTSSQAFVNEVAIRERY